MGDTDDAPLVVARQGSFFVGGRRLTAPGTYDPALSPDGSDPGQQFWVDQMYVQYQQGGQASVLHLPEAGLFGNSHFMFSDLNNVQVADQLSLFLRGKGLHRR